MKKLLITLSLLLSVPTFAQYDDDKPTTPQGPSVLKYSDLTTELNTKLFNEYTSKDGTVFKVGEKLKVGAPSGVNFQYVQDVDPITGPRIVGPLYANTELEIKKIQINGNLRKGYKVWVITSGGVLLSKLYFDINNALEMKEVKGDGLSSDEALTELKRAKDKLDLGLITQDEFMKQRMSLSKYIK